MAFEDFLKIYYEDMEVRLRESTMRTKRYIIDLKILPYFKNLSMNSIKPADIRKWQNSLISQGYSPTYIKTVYNQLNAVFNYAVRYHDLKANPCAKAGSIGKNKADEMKFWTKEQFEKFIEGVIDKQMSYVIFMVLYWTGIRVGELLALTPSDIDINNKTISVTKSYQRIDKRDMITPPKTPKSNREISIPDFLAADLQDYMNSLYDLDKNERLFPVSK